MAKGAEGGRTVSCVGAGKGADFLAPPQTRRRAWARRGAARKRTRPAGDEARAHAIRNARAARTRRCKQRALQRAFTRLYTPPGGTHLRGASSAHPRALLRYRPARGPTHPIRLRLAQSNMAQTGQSSSRLWTASRPEGRPGCLRWQLPSSRRPRPGNRVPGFGRPPVSASLRRPAGPGAPNLQRRTHAAARAALVLPPSMSVSAVYVAAVRFVLLPRGSCSRRAARAPAATLPRRRLCSSRVVRDESLPERRKRGICGCRRIFPRRRLCPSRVAGAGRRQVCLSLEMLGPSVLDLIVDYGYKAHTHSPSPSPDSIASRVPYLSSRARCWTLGCVCGV